MVFLRATRYYDSTGRPARVFMLLLKLFHITDGVEQFFGSGLWPQMFEPLNSQPCAYLSNPDPRLEQIIKIELRLLFVNIPALGRSERVCEIGMYQSFFVRRALGKPRAAPENVQCLFGGLEKLYRGMIIVYLHEPRQDERKAYYSRNKV